MTDAEMGWQVACDELTAALERGAGECGISREALAVVDAAMASRDSAALREAAWAVRRETPAMARQSREVAAWRRAFWTARGVDPDVTPWPAKRGR